MLSSQAINTQIPVNILVVSNEALVQARVRASIPVDANIQVVYASSAKSALKTLRSQEVDFLIGDIDTTDIDGWRLSRLVRSGILKCKMDVPIVMISTTWCERIAEVTAREYGVNQMLSIDHIDRIPEIISDYCANRVSVLPKPRLLVIEDQKDTSDLIERVLCNSFDIEVANDGELGLKAWRERRHELVLLDIMLPSLSGKDILLRIMREAPGQAIVIMTAHASIDQAEELMLKGAVDFLPKPFRAEQLRKVCNIASLREDFLVSNAQFAARVESLKERESQYKNLYESHHRLLDDLQSVVMKLDGKLAIKFFNRTWKILTGYPSDKTVDRPLEDFIATEDLANYRQFKNKLNDVLTNKIQSCQAELSLIDCNSQKIAALFKASASSLSEGEPEVTLCIDDISERKRAQKQLEHLAMHDSLTGLYNRHYFEASLEQLATDSHRYNRIHGLIYLDLDYFKVINDTFGHQRGDEVLQEVSGLLKQRVRSSDLLCRLGGDEFAVLLHDVSDTELKKFAQEIQQAVGAFSFELQEQRIHLGCSIGLASIDGRAKNAEEYLMQADIALYVAKGRGRNLIHLFDPRDDEGDAMRLNINWSQKIREGIDQNRLVLYFQPVVDIVAQKVTYYEALVRYKEANGDIIGPSSFIPALENTGDMQILDRRIIELATRTLKKYPQLNHIAVNLSAQAFKDENLVPCIIESLDKSGINADRLTFELTESASLSNLSITQQVITNLHELGCHFSVDDFGSGFSSFSYLKQLPADYIKLDGSFIKNLDKDEVDQALVRSIIQVIQALGKKAVAEYVENEKILRILKAMGIDYVQGYHIGRPLPPEELFNVEAKNKD